jgi:hypothetical protein
VVQSAIPVLLDPAARVDFQPFQPYTRVAGIEQALLEVTDTPAQLASTRHTHVFLKLATQPRHGEIKPGGRHDESELVRQAELGVSFADSLCPMPGMAKGKIPPFRTENPAHNAAAKDDMLLPLKAVHIAFPNVASVMQKAGRPDPEIPRKPEQFPPPIGDEQWMKPNRMDSKKYTLGSDSHPE